MDISPPILLMVAEYIPETKNQQYQALKVAISRQTEVLSFLTVETCRSIGLKIATPWSTLGRHPIRFVVEFGER
jgi:hypothetical protein